jgi:LruC domain-containing protein
MRYFPLIGIVLLLFQSLNCEKTKKNVVPFQLQQQVAKNSQIIANKTVGNTAPEVTAVYETETFSYQTIQVITIDASVVDGNDAPIVGALVEIRDTGNVNTIYQQVSNSNGRVQGSLNLNTTETTIYVYVTYRGVTTPAKAVPIRTGNNQVLVRITQIKIDVSSSTLASMTTSGGSSSANTFTDTDGDGVVDAYDDYPNDSTKATKLKFPASGGVNTIGFEGLFPAAGDADLNDTVVVYYIEEDLNAAGQIIEIRGNYQYMAHGASTKHSLYLRLPSTVNITYSSEIRNGNGVLQASGPMTKSTTEATGINAFTPSVTDLQDGLRILGNTDTTMGASNWNTRTTDTTYVNGYIAKIKIVFNTPVTRSVLGLAPYDTFIRLESRAVDGTYPAEAPRSVTTAGSFQVYEVHRPGFYKYTSQVTVDGDLREIGEDIYIDKNNFPFSVIVPGLWKWPEESEDIRNSSTTGYPKFATWTSSQGQQDRDWYNDTSAATNTKNYYAWVSTNRSALDTPSSFLTAHIGKVSLEEYQTILFVLVLVITGTLFLRYKFSPIK